MRLKCLLTIHPELHKDHVWFGNGYTQNIKFFYDLLALMGHEPHFVVAGSEAPRGTEIRGRTYRVIDQAALMAAPEPFDIVFEAGVSLNELLAEAQGECKIDFEKKVEIKADVDSIVRLSNRGVLLRKGQTQLSVKSDKAAINGSKIMLG